MRSKIRYLVRDGSCNFVYDDWSGQGSIEEILPDLVPFCPNIPLRDVFVAGRWLSHQLPQQLESFLAGFSFIFIGEPDLLIWEPDSAGIFSLKSAYAELRKSQAQQHHLQFIWQPLVPMKMSFFAWRLWNRLLPFPDVLSAIGFNMPSKCPLCPSSDFIDHCFLSCRMAQDLWRWTGSLLQLDVPLSGGLNSLFAFFWDSNTTSMPRELLQIFSHFCLLVYLESSESNSI